MIIGAVDFKITEVSFRCRGAGYTADVINERFGKLMQFNSVIISFYQERKFSAERIRTNGFVFYCDAFILECILQIFSTVFISVLVSR